MPLASELGRSTSISSADHGLMDARDYRGWMAKVLDSDDNQGPSGGLDAFSAKVILLSLGSVSFVVPSVVFHQDAKVLED